MNTRTEFGYNTLLATTWVGDWYWMYFLDGKVCTETADGEFDAPWDDMGEWEV